MFYNDEIKSGKLMQFVQKNANKKFTLPEEKKPETAKKVNKKEEQAKITAEEIEKMKKTNQFKTPQAFKGFKEEKKQEL